MKAVRLCFALGTSLSLGAVVFSGCRSATQVTLQITTDVPCNKLQGVTVTVGPPGLVEGKAPTVSTAACDPATGHIGSLALVPSGSPDDEVVIRVLAGVDQSPEACTPPEYRGCIVARRDLRYLPHENLQILVPLRSVCKSISCNPQSTCVSGTCTSDVVSNLKPCTDANGCGEATLTPPSGIGAGGSSGEPGAGGTMGGEAGMNSSGAAGVGEASGSTGSGGNAANTGQGGMSESAGSGGESAAAGSSGTGGAVAVCGNGKVEGSEQCDGSDLRGITCSAAVSKAATGTLGCTSRCTLDPTKCAWCGDGIIEDTEQCDGANLNGKVSCADAVGTGSMGTLVCGADCKFDVSNCSMPASCGNGKAEGSEQCDGNDFRSASCASATGDANAIGPLGCTSKCMFDTGKCAWCGNGKAESNEQCDGTDLRGATCAVVGGTTGTPVCTAQCTLDTSGCCGCGGPQPICTSSTVGGCCGPGGPGPVSALRASASPITSTCPVLQ